MAEQKKIHTLEELQKLINGWDKSTLLSEYLNPEDVEVSEVPYESRLQQMMGNPKAVQELLKTGNKAFIKKYAQSMLKDKGLFDLYEMNLDNVAEELKNVSGDEKFSKEDILGQKQPYLNIDGKTLEAVAKVNGWDFPSMLKMISEAQTKQARKDIYDDNLAARTVFPRISKNLMETGDYDWQDVALDIGENVLQAAPLAGTGTKVATIGLRSGLSGVKPLAASVAGSLIENATVPTVMAAADEVRKDNGSFADFLERSAEGAMINAFAGKAIGSGLSAISSNPMIASRIREMLDTGDDALKNKLEGIYKILKDPSKRRLNPEEVKKANNELNLLIRQADFTNKGVLDPKWYRPKIFTDVNIADYAAKNSKAREVGKQAREIYEDELIANAEQPWAKKVRLKEQRYEPNSTYFTNREAIFPHMFVNQEKVGSQAGLLKTPGRHNLDEPEFKNFNWNDLEQQNLVKNQLAKMFADHHSGTFHYDVDFDKVVDDILKDPEMVKAIIRAYGGTNPREAVTSFITNKLGRDQWLERARSSALRSFGEYSGLKPKKKEKE